MENIELGQKAANNLNNGCVDIKHARTRFIGKLIIVSRVHARKKTMKQLYEVLLNEQLGKQLFRMNPVS